MYSQKHRLFLYQLLKNGVFPIKKALLFCKTIKAEEVTDSVSLQEFTNIINREIKKQEFKIVLNICEVTGQHQVILITTANSDISRLQNTFTALQLEFFQRILLEIVSTEDKTLEQIHYLNLSTKLTGKLSHADAEKLIGKWIRMGYFVKHGSNIYLGSRCIIEFTSFFREHCKDDIEECSLCLDLVFKGKDCISCKKVMHNHCLKKFLERHSSCPECKVEWRNREDLQGNSQESPEENSDEDITPSRKRR